MYETAWHPLTLDWIRAYENRSYKHFVDPRHATAAITAEAQGMIRAHRVNGGGKPLFMYVAFTAAHSPLQPMPEHLAKCMHIKHLWRRQFCGMVVGVDEALRNITQTALSELGSDTVMVFTSDNGGSTWFGESVAIVTAIS
jgi:arylsulfatase A-like enzyme